MHSPTNLFTVVGWREEEDKLGAQHPSALFLATTRSKINRVSECHVVEMFLHNFVSHSFFLVASFWFCPPGM